jgi:hypothetical protein
MDDWFEHLVKDVVWKGIQDEVGNLEGQASSAIHDKLVGLQVGKKLSSSPLVQVVATDDSSVTLLVRGRFKLFGGAAAPFLRLQVRVSKTVDTHLSPPLTILHWDTVVGDLQITKDGVFTAELGFGYDAGTWLGRGAFKVIPAGFGLDLLLGGLDERGLMVGIDVHLPTPIPLGSSGAALIGVGGDFAYNFVPRLNHGVPKPRPWDATDYVAWAKDAELDRWQPGPPDKAAVGIGLHAGFGDLPTLGWLLKLDPVGLAVITPGPIFVLGGKGKLINTDAIEAEGYVAVDVASESIALGLDVHAEEKWGKFKLLDAKGSLDAFFSFQHASDWYVRFGTSTSPIKGEVFEALDADLFLMLGHAAVPAPDGTAHDGIFFGVGLSYGGKWEWWIIKVVAKIGARVAVGIGWNPLELEGAFAFYGELGLEVWEFGLKIVLQTELTGHVAKPTKLTGDVHFNLDLPWPIPDIPGTVAYTIGDADGPPHLESPLLLGSAT